MKARRAAVCALVALAVGHVSTQPFEGMVRFAGGAFVMGTEVERVAQLMGRFGTKRRELFLAEVPAHRVTLRPFFIDRTEVTNGAYKKWSGESFPAEESELPETFVTWDKAVTYCASLGKRLPTEAEWEFAAGGGTPAEFPWGNDMPDPTKANWQGTGLGKPARVGSYSPTGDGLYDMAGNVWEFVQDTWKDTYEDAAAFSHDRRVIRGGSFGGAPINLRVRFRDSHPVNGAAAHVGFRCARAE